MDTPMKASGRRSSFKTARLGRDIVVIRNAIQVSFALYLLWAGWRFYLFVRHFETGGVLPYVSRPASVEAFLPISSLTALKAWFGTGQLDPVHPAGVVILVAIIAVSFLYKKAFCSWACPIGTLSEVLARAGKWLAGRNFDLPVWIDWPLRSLKYLILAFFLKTIVIDMPAVAAVQFLHGDYNKIADVKMLYFFTRMDAMVLLFLGLLFFASMFVANFWCRYLCPYGALLGLVSAISPLKVTRFSDKCTGCGKCNEACPHRIDVMSESQIHSVECTGCLNCVAACKRKGALGMATWVGKRTVPPWTIAAAFSLSFFLIVVGAQIAGYWGSSLTYQDYQRLVPMSQFLSH